MGEEKLTQETVIRELMRALKEKENKEHEPIAIIGMACRFPGNVNTPNDLWNLLKEGKDGIVDVPPSRWDADAFYDPDKDAPGKMYVKKGGFLQQPVDMFDAEFFRISPKEAEDMDPQQRISLEVAVDAIESASISLDQLHGSPTGVYMGICLNDYGHLILQSDIAAVDKYYSTGNHFSVLSGRISYSLGFTGPAISLDTACSSSLVAVDTAVKDLRIGRCNLALAGGVNLILSPETSINFCKAGMLSPEGYCKTFDASADGYSRGEGCGILVLKRISDAIKEKNPIYAIIRGSSVNQDGASSGLTVPNGLAQQEVIREALEDAQLKPQDITFLEAHGTGTSLGDPIEVEALAQVYAKQRDPAHPLFIGSVKTNIGHTEGAAGVAGVIKAVLSLLYKQLPKHLHFKKINPNMDLENIRIPLENTPMNSGTIFAAVNSFGFSGTNAHIILQQGTAEDLSKLSTVHPFQRRRYWSKAAVVSTGKKLSSIHPLIGEMQENPDGRITYRNEINLPSLSYLKDHQVFKSIIFPGAGYFEMMLASAHYGIGEGVIEITQASIEAALRLTQGKPTETLVQMSPSELGYEVAIYTHILDKWNCHARGKIVVLDKAEKPKHADLSALKARCKQLDDFYSRVNASGIYYGEHFQTINKVYVGDREAIGEISLKDDSHGYFAHPALLDGCLQLVVANDTTLCLPIGCDRLRLYAPLGDHIVAHWQETDANDSGRSGNLTLYSPLGEVLATLEGMHYRNTTEAALQKTLAHEESVEEWLYEWVWEDYTPEEILQGNWLTVGDQPKTKDEYIELLKKEKMDGILHVATKSSSLQEVQDIECKDALHLYQAMVELQSRVPLRIVSSSNFFHGSSLGLFRTVLAERPGLDIKYIQVGDNYDSKLLRTKSAETILKIDGDKIQVPRLLRSHDAKAKKHELIRPSNDLFRLQSKQKGLLENLTLFPLVPKDVLAPHEVEVEVRAVGLNFRDVLDSLGLYPGDAGPLGGDGAGIVTRVGNQVKNVKPGDRVLGMMSGCLARKVCVHEDTITKQPDNMNFEEAASIPTVFLTVYYAFTRCMKLKQGDTVLIHAAAGGVGQAAIQIAKLLGANIIATAGDDKKRALLRTQGIERVYDSRNLSFGNEIKGVDAVLNSLSGSGFIETSVSVCKTGAYFLEIGKRDIWTKEQMHDKRPDINYFTIALDNIAQESPHIIQEMLKELMPLFEKAKLSVIPITVFPIEKAIAAFEYMQAAKHIGKVVISIPPYNFIRPDASYLITGGLGGLGQTLAKWLISQGAKHIVLTGRSPLKQALEPECTYEMLDISDENAVKQLFLKYPFRGIFHLAGVLDDATLMEQDWGHFQKVFAPKVYGSYNLHQYSKDLDYFVMFSSIASSFGNPGQSNYAAANAFMDALCQYRRSQGLPALSISWGPWAEVGMAKELASRHAKAGLNAMQPLAAMRALELALHNPNPHVTIANINWNIFLKQKIVPPTWLGAFVKKGVERESFVAQLEKVEPTQRFELVKSFVANTLREVLGIPSSQSINEKTGFFDMGLDSLMAVELKNKLQNGLGSKVMLPATIVFDCSSLQKMCEFLAIEFGIKEKEIETSVKEVEEKILREEVQQLSDEEILKNLEKELHGRE